jgi:glycosyltransferase involved in cell wall biosynthesis
VKGLSAILITRNEERNVEACLASLGFAEEIVVVDSGSTDGTEALCRKDPRVRWHSEDWKGFGRQKNRAVEKAAGPWIFSIDADERATPELADEISRMDLERSPEAGYRVPRRSFFGGRWVRHGGWYPDYTIRLWRKDAGRFEERPVHEAVRVSGPVGTLRGDLLHYTYRDTADFVARMNRYSSLGAEELARRGKRVSAFDFLLRPPFTFFKMFVLKRGFLDGKLGLRLAVLYSMYTFVKYVKAWEAGGDPHRGRGSG